MPDSPAQGYGCQTFLENRQFVNNEKYEVTTIHNPPIGYDLDRYEFIEVSGSIDSDTNWNADTVRVVGDIEIENGITLTITPGVIVEFQGFYKIDVLGTILAIGLHDQKIRFTITNPEYFTLDHSQNGCWNGFRFPGTLASNEGTRFEYCIFEYSKAISYDPTLLDFGGGALSTYYFSKLTIENCIFQFNLADFGGALYFEHYSAPKILNNLFVNNYALENASVIYCSNSYPQITNNTIVENTILNEENPYIESTGILSFISKPRFTNNIIRNNDPVNNYMHTQVWENKDFYTNYNNIQEYETINGNIDLDPLFWGNGIYPYSLGNESPCIDQGVEDFPLTEITGYDLTGVPRIVGSTIDLGAYEYNGNGLFGDVNCDDLINVLDIIAVVQYITIYSEPECFINMDVNYDGLINILDVIGILNNIIG